MQFILFFEQILVNYLSLVITLSQLKYSDTLTLTILTVFDVISTHAPICAQGVFYELFNP